MSKEALIKRHQQGWLKQITDSLDECISIIRRARKDKETLSLGYHGNVVHLWQVLLIFWRNLMLGDGIRTYVSTHSFIVPKIR